MRNLGPLRRRTSPYEHLSIKRWHLSQGKSREHLIFLRRQLSQACLEAFLDYLVESMEAHYISIDTFTKDKVAGEKIMAIINISEDM